LYPKDLPIPDAPAIPLAGAFDLTAYDILVANISGGKDSQTMLRKVVRLATLQGVLDRVIAVHCDLGRVEWDGTLELAKAHAALYGIRFIVVARPQGDLLDHAIERAERGKPAFPGFKTRWCTSDHKTSQVYKVMTALVDELNRSRPLTKRPVKILNILGNRAEESAEREAQLPFAWNKYASNQTKRHVWNWLPIHDMLETEVWADIHASGVPYHHAYGLGMPRLSCCFCIYSGFDAMVLAAQHNPKLAAEYSEVEVKFGFQLKQDFSMAEVIEAAKTAKVTSVANWAA
jgi:3'-phosphoadenosine 5'-phosphosulfate sulfotransferase (PAPS reductase)/FAD synthetase